MNLDKEAVLDRHPSIDHLVGAAGIGRILDVAVAKGQRLMALPHGAPGRARVGGGARGGPRGEAGGEGGGALSLRVDLETTSLRSHLEEDRQVDRPLAPGPPVRAHSGHAAAEAEAPKAHEAAAQSAAAQSAAAQSAAAQSAAAQSAAASEAARAAARAYLEAGEAPRLVATPPHLAYLKIAEGCKKRCSFCVIPRIKGPLRSKAPEQVLREFRALVRSGPGVQGTKVGGR